MEIDAVPRFKLGSLPPIDLETIRQVDVLILDVVAWVQFRFSRIVRDHCSFSDDKRHRLRSTIDDVRVRYADWSVIRKGDLLDVPVAKRSDWLGNNGIAIAAAAISLFSAGLSGRQAYLSNASAQQSKEQFIETQRPVIELEDVKLPGIVLQRKAS